MSGDDVVFPSGGGAVHLACQDGHGATEPTVSLTCRLCLIPIVAGELAFCEGPALVHVECHDRATAGGAVGDFLESKAGWPFCHACLSLRLRLRWDAVRKAVWALRVSRNFQVRPGTCSQCNTARVVIAAVGGSERDATG